MTTRPDDATRPGAFWGFEDVNARMTLLSVHEGRGLAWRVDEPIIYHARDGATHIVPIGFVSDLTTCFPEGRWSLASVLHDWHYHAGTVTRARADAIYREAMESLGVTWRRRWLIWTGVRLGGWVPWRRYRRAA